MDHFEIEDHLDSILYFVLETVHLEAVALENNLRTSRVRDLLQDGLHLSGIETCLRHEDVERYGQKPDRGDIELTGLPLLSDWRDTTLPKLGSLMT